MESTAVRGLSSLMGGRSSTAGLEGQMGDAACDKQTNKETNKQNILHV